MNQKYFAECSVGNDIFDILEKSSHVMIENQWRPILGYDEFDDILCAENYSGDDYTIIQASEILTYKDFKIAVEIQER